MKVCFEPKFIVAAVFAALTSACFCQAHFEHTDSTYLNFHIPHRLRTNSSWPHVVSGFGRLGHGKEGSMVLPVKMLHIKDQYLCNNNIDQVAALNSLKIPADSGSPFMLLVTRGVCTFVKKVRNAQNLGAAAVLIADTENSSLPSISSDDEDILFLDSDPHDKPDHSNHTEHEHEYRMPDDGSGRDISIPSVMIAKKEFAAIKDVIDSQPNYTGIVVAEFAWHVPKFDNKVVMELWTSPSSWHAKQFLASNFSAIAKTFDLNEMHGNTHENESYNDKMNLLRFQERPVLIDGEKLGCLGNSDAPDEPCYKMCTNGGRYCHAHQHHADGKDIVTEALRRLCISHHYASPKYYWDYIDHFSNFCWGSDYFANEKCINDAFHKSNIKKEHINSCFSDSGEPSKASHNSLLQDALTLQRKRGVHMSPTVMINHEPSALVSWLGFTPRNVLIDLCSTFAYGEKPHVCYACEMCGDPIACAKRSPMKCLKGDGDEKEDPNAHKEEDNSKKGNKHSTKHKVIRWIFALFLVGGCFGGYVMYKKKMEESGEAGFGSYSLQQAFLSDSS